MALIGPRPFLEIQIAQLKAQGVRRFVLGTGYRAGMIEEHFGDGSRFGVEIAYSREDEPLGTGGAMRLAAGQLSDPVLILNGDSFCEFGLSALSALLERTQADLAMVVWEMVEAGRYGCVSLDGERLTGFQEKKEGATGWINAGIYLCRRSIIEAIPTGRAVSFERDILPELCRRGRCQVMKATGTFIDIGVPEDYQRAQTVLAPFGRL
jgi:NDP-sugar pyrophosphorylase family protein